MKTDCSGGNYYHNEWQSNRTWQIAACKCTLNKPTLPIKKLIDKLLNESSYHQYMEKKHNINMYCTRNG